MKYHRWSDEEVQFLRDHEKDFESYATFAEAVNSAFGIGVTGQQVKDKCNDLKISIRVMHWTPEMDSFLRSMDGMTYRQMVDEFVEEFGISVKYNALKTHCLKIGVHGLHAKYSQEHIDLIRQMASSGASYTKIAEQFEQQTGRHATNQSIRNVASRNKCEKNHSQVKAIGSRLKGLNGYWLVKVAHGENKRNYRYEHIVLWEQHHGKIPPKHCIMFLDGDKDNVTIDNLYCVPRAVLTMLVSFGWTKEHDRELMLTKIKYCELQLAMKNARKGGNHAT